MRFFGVNFSLQKFCLCKKNDKYQVCVCVMERCDRKEELNKICQSDLKQLNKWGIFCIYCPSLLLAS